MCAQSQIKANLKRLERIEGVEVPEDWDDWSDTRIVPHLAAPVLAFYKGKPTIRKMKFSLVPSWSKEPKVKFATHNARLESEDPKTGMRTYIFEKPTWRGPFSKHHCLVPISWFIEPIYQGKYAGNMVRFFDKREPLLAAAGIWDEWVNKETGEVLESYSIITDEPDPFVAKTGHDRMPVFLNDKTAHDWLFAKPDEKPKHLIEMIRAGKTALDLDVEIDRPMKAGWEKRL